MKAKDLAALAALGVAGYAAYDKFGKKSEEPKLRGKLGESGSAVDDSAGEYRSDMLGKSRSANDGDVGNDADYVMPRTAPRQVAADDDYVMPRTAPRDIGGMRPEDVGQGGSQSATSSGYNKLRAAGANSKTPAAALTDYVAPRTVAKPVEAAPAAVEAAPAVVKDYKQPFAKYPDAPAYTEATPAQRIAAVDAASGASHPSTKKTEELRAYSRAEAAKDLERKKANGTFVPIPQKVKVTRPEGDPNFVSPEEGMKAYGTRAGYQTPQGVINYAPTQQVANARDYARKNPQPSIASMLGFKKGGAVKKMASGGLASSKMSKPSGASRGDGIAQRGRTRGTLR
jgi:hypothetical protein